MLFELIIFAVVFVMLQTVFNVGLYLLLMKYFMSKKFIKKYTKMVVEIGNEISEEIMDEEEF